MHTYIHIYIYVCTNVPIYIHIYIYVYMYRYRSRSTDQTVYNAASGVYPGFLWYTCTYIFRVVGSQASMGLRAHVAGHRGLA